MQTTKLGCINRFVVYKVSVDHGAMAMSCMHDIQALTTGHVLQSILLPFERSQTMKFTQHELIALAFHSTGTTLRLWPLIRLSE